MACLETSDINENFLKNNLPLTPFDSIQLFKALKENLSEKIVGKLDIYNVFPEDNKRLTLEDSRIYESKLKSFLLEIKKTNPNKLSHILNKFHKDILENQENVDLYKLFKSIKIKI